MAAPADTKERRQGRGEIDAGLLREGQRTARRDFTQTYVNQAFKKTLTSTGTLKFKKPGMVRFDYLTPEPKLSVVRRT